MLQEVRDRNLQKIKDHEAIFGGMQNLDHSNLWSFARELVCVECGTGTISEGTFRYYNFSPNVVCWRCQGYK